jgi:Sulfotransferase family
MTDPFPFVVARGRSGTTLLRAILNAHPDLAIPGESWLILKFGPHRSRYESEGGFDADLLAEDLIADDVFRRWRFGADEVRSALTAAEPRTFGEAVRAMYGSYAAREGKPRYGDKAANHVLVMDEIARLLPEARFVHLIRDGRDVALSFLQAEFGTTSLGEAAAEWERFVRTGRASGRALGPQRYLEVRYEHLVSQPESTVREVCAFLDLPFEPAMLRYHEDAEPLIANLTYEGEHRNLSRPPTEGLRDWRVEMDPHDVVRFESIAGDLLEELGYERATTTHGLTTRLFARKARLEVLARNAAQSRRRRRKTADTFRRASRTENVRSASPTQPLLPEEKRP